MLSQLEGTFSPDQCVARDSTRSITAAGLLQRAHALAEELAQLEFIVLALQIDNSIDWLLIDLACQQADICLVPIPGFFSRAQIEHVLTQAPIDAFIGERSAAIESMLGEAVLQRGMTNIGGLPWLRLQPAPSSQKLPEHTGKITFTSGSTGQPKGVCLSKQQLQLQAKALADAVGLQQPRHLCLLPLSTLLENVAGLYAPLLSGGEVIIPALAEIGFTGSSELNAQKYLASIQRYQPNSIILTPQLLLMLVSAAATGWQVPASLQFVAVGGGKVSPSLLQQADELGIPAYEGYGLSECASVVSLNTPAQLRPGSCGQPLPHVQVSIEAGEIVVRGNAMLGYLGEPESWGQQAIRTGDLGSLDQDGFVCIHGRSKNLLISSFGRNINPEWVESELLSQSLLSECVVLGDARPYCVALLSPRQAQTRDEAIKQHIDCVNLRLPDYARIKRWHRLSQPLHQQATLLTANGRPKRAAIAKHFAALIDCLYHQPNSQTPSQTRSQPPGLKSA